MHLNSSRFLSLCVCTVFIGCSSDGGSPDGNGGAQSGGANAAGGSSSGGAASGGAATSGGGSLGGAANGGASFGGTAAGGSANGGASVGGASAGGAYSGGASSGGAAAKGGSTSGGASGAGASGGGAGGVAGSMSGGGGGTSGNAGSTSTAGAGSEMPSAGCGKTPTIKSSGSSNFMPNTITVAGASRQYVLRRPQNYDNARPYRLIFDLHGYGGSYSETAGSYFGLWDLSKDSTIFVALSAPGGDWRSGDNLAYVDAVLKAVEADMCIDSSRVMLEGFSQGAAMSWSLACSRPGVFRAVVGHSGGGVPNPTSCKPVPYLGSGGLQESVTQTTQTDQFAKWNGCTVATLPSAKSGSHVCTDYSGCPATAPVRWCSYDGPHTPSPSDSGQRTSWMPQEVWTFFSKF